MLKGENIIIFSSADWERGPTSPQHISTNFAKENKVLFIETFGSRSPTLTGDHIKRIGARIINWFKGIKRQNFRNGMLYIYSPILFRISFLPFLFINKLIFLFILKRLIRKLDLDRPILYFYLPPPQYIKGELNEKAIIYHCVDEWEAFAGGSDKAFMESERRLIRDADLVITVNQVLYEKKKLFANRIYKIYHGVDYEHFSKEFTDDCPLPSDLERIPKPIIALVGSFADWIDLDLIKEISQRHKEWSIVSIGHIESNVNINAFDGMSNIYCLGQKKYYDLPNYYRLIDVFIIPFLINEHIKYCTPIRLYEHLSSGKPVVASNFAAASEIGKGLISIAYNKEDFIVKIEEALRENDGTLKERRRELAKANTWDYRVEEISEIIKKVVL